MNGFAENRLEGSQKVVDRFCTKPLILKMVSCGRFIDALKGLFVGQYSTI